MLNEKCESVKENYVILIICISDIEILMKLRCGIFAYIFYSVDYKILTVCSRIISNIYFQVYSVFVKILYAGISTLLTAIFNF